LLIERVPDDGHHGHDAAHLLASFIAVVIGGFRRMHENDDVQRSTLLLVWCRIYLASCVEIGTSLQQLKHDIVSTFLGGQM